MHKVGDTIKGIGAILLLLGAVAVWMGVSIIPESIDRPPVNAGEDQEKAVETPDKPWWQDDKIE